MKKGKNEERYDQDSILYVGPSSKPFNISRVAQSPYLTQEPAELQFSHSLSQSTLSRLASRCSTRSIGDEVKKLSGDGKVVEALRKRLLTWGESLEEDGAKEGGRKKSKRGHAKDGVDDTLEELDVAVPEAFRITKRSCLSVYYDREGLLEQSCIKRVVPTLILQTSKRAATNEQEESRDGIAEKAKEGTSSSPLVLGISIYARPVRGLWAKERVQQLAGKGAILMDDMESEASSVSSKEAEEARMRKGERSLYGSLQLVQKIEIQSSSTLEDLRESLLCRMEDLPERIPGDGDVPQYSGYKRRTDSCFLIEGQLYGEKPTEEDYADLLERSLPAKASPKNMRDIQLDSLFISTGKLYWFLHQGSCEHLWTIRSVRKMDKNEVEESFPSTTFLASVAVMHPLAKWTQTKNGGVRLAYTLDKCELCKSNQASMLLVGGSRFKPQSPVQLAGLKQDTTCICHMCLSALRGKKPASVAELIQQAGDDNVGPYLSTNVSPTETEGKWTLIPAFE